MQDLNKTLNEIIGNHTPLKIQKYDNSNKLKIYLTSPYRELGLNANDWLLLRTAVRTYWNEDDQILTARANDVFNTKIAPRYLNAVSSLRKAKILPRVVLSIICQNPDLYALQSFLDVETELPLIQDYLYQLSTISTPTPISYSAVSIYTLELTSDFAFANSINGVNQILWDGASLKSISKNQIYGVKHIWDHYDYPHIHVIDTFDDHKVLSLNAIKRTWLAALSITAGTKQPYTRLCYGYMAEQMLPPYNVHEYKELAVLNYATVIKPPFDFARIFDMTLAEIESIAKSVLSCYNITPTLNTVYITPNQLGQEKTLGNKPIQSRYTLVLPLEYLGKLILYKQFTTIQLPTGNEFDVDTLLQNVEVSFNVGTPDFIINAPTADHLVTKNPLSDNNGLILDVRDYVGFMDQLRYQNKNQFSVSSIIKTISPDNLNIVVTTLAEQAVAVTALNENAQGANLNIPLSINNAILEKTTASHIFDYYISTQLTDDLIIYRAIIEFQYSSMNVVIVSPEVFPSTFSSICKSSGVSLEVFSTNGAIGMKLATLFSSYTSSANMFFITMTETEYLADIAVYELFMTSIRQGVFYSIEFIDFSENNLSAAIATILESLQLLQDKDDVKMLFTPPILNSLCVGIRLVFSLVDLNFITTEYRNITDMDLQVYSRKISTDRIEIDPIKSLTYKRNVIPRMGTHLTVTCQQNDYQQALGYMSTLCRYTTTNSFSSAFTYYQIEGFVDQSRIVLLDRMKMFRSNVSVKPQQILPNDSSNKTALRTGRLTHFEIVTQTDRLLLYLRRRNNGSIANDLSDYGSAHFLNLCNTDAHYTMYDIDAIDIPDSVGIDLIRGILQWNEPLPYIANNDVLIYNSIFMNPQSEDVDLAAVIITMLTPIIGAKNVHFNLPVMTPSLFAMLQPLDIITLRGTRYFLKLSEFPAIPCLTENELSRVLAIFTTPQYTVYNRIPTLLDYFFVSRMIQRWANLQVYHNAVMIHRCIPFFEAVLA